MAAGAGWYATEEDNICALVASTQLPEHAWRLAHNNRLLYSGSGKNAEQAAYVEAIGGNVPLGDVEAWATIAGRGNGIEATPAPLPGDDAGED